MKKNIFDLSLEQFTQIAATLKGRIADGLEKKGQEILAIPTYINPRKEIKNEKVLVLDLGGTNYRVAVVEFKDGQPEIHPKDGYKRKLSALAMKDEQTLFKEITDPIVSLDLTGVSSIGFCFSFPADSTLDGDAVLVRWTKGFDIPSLTGKPVGATLKEYLNKALEGRSTITKINVINDTVASLFSGLTDQKAQGHIGLIVGTGTNMAAFFDAGDIKKIDPGYKQKGSVAVNLESGNFRPPFLSVVDEKIDRYSDTRGSQRFEKAISGLYLGRILEYVFSCDEFEEGFDAAKLTHMMSYPDMYKDDYVAIAHLIYERSAKLVAASLAGLIAEMAACNPSIKNVRLMADGSLFWSKDAKGKCGHCFKSYKDVTMDCLATLLCELGLGKVTVNVEEQENINLIGSAIAGLS
jgi:hexokinase